MELHEEASKILNHPIVAKFFEEAKKKNHRIIETSKFSEEEVRTDAYLRICAINDLEECLKEYIAMGELKTNPIVKRLKSLD